MILTRIVRFALIAPASRSRFLSVVLDGVRILKGNPGASAPVEELSGYRDLKLPFGSSENIIRYREEPQRVLIVKVRHSKEEDF